MVKTGRQFSIAALIFYVTIVNYLTRFALSYAIIPIERNLKMDDFYFGIAASGFTLGYFLMTIPIGILIDKFGSIRIWTLAAFAWSFIAISLGFTSRFSTLFTFLFFLGVAEAAHFPALLKTIGDWLEPKWKTRALALCLLGVPLSAVIGGPFLTSLIQAQGWRSTFLILGCLGLLWAQIWPLLFLDRKNPHRSTTRMPFDEKAPISYKSFLASPSFLSNCATYFVFGYILFFALSWIPGYLLKMHKTTLSDAGYYAVLPWLFGSLFLLFGGWLSDRLFQKTRSLRIARTYLIAASLLGSALFFFLLALTDDLFADLWLLSFGVGFLFLLNAPIYALNADLYPRHAATAQGIIVCCSSLGGALSASLTGAIYQSTKSFDSAFLLIAILALIAAAIALLFQKPKSRVN
jgi:predicted MFS family arabinose efflux permease